MSNDRRDSLANTGATGMPTPHEAPFCEAEEGPYWPKSCGRARRAFEDHFKCHLLHLIGADMKCEHPA